MHAVPAAMAAAAEKHGVEFRYSTEVTSIETVGDRAVAVITADGERIPADVVVLNPDLPVAYRDLLGREPWSVQAPDLLPLVLPAARRVVGDVQQDRAPQHPLRPLVEGRVRRAHRQEAAHERPEHPRHEPDALRPVARPRRQGDLLRPVPDPEPRRRPSTGAPRARATATRSCARWRSAATSGSATRSRSRTSRRRSTGRPAAWSAAHPFASAHSFFQTGPFRPGNLWGENVVFTGSGTQPGVGVPMVLVSGRLAAERITGPDRAYRSPRPALVSIASTLRSIRPARPPGPGRHRPRRRSAPSGIGWLPLTSQHARPTRSSARCAAPWPARWPPARFVIIGLAVLLQAWLLLGSELLVAAAGATTRPSVRQVLGVLALLVGAAAARAAHVQPRRLLVLRAGPRVRRRATTRPPSAST